MSTVLSLLGMIAAIATAAAVIASGRRGSAVDSSYRRSEPSSVNPIQQRARDYIASGAIPRWD